MSKRLSDIFCVFQIHLARLRREAGPFLMAAIVFPIGMYLFASGIAHQTNETISNDAKLHFLAASMVFSLSLTAISWLGYLLLENRFTGRLKLFATLPLAPSSYVFGVLVFALAQGAIGTISMLAAAKILGVETNIGGATRVILLALTVFLALLSLCGISVIIAAKVRFTPTRSARDSLCSLRFIIRRKLCPLFCAGSVTFYRRLISARRSIKF